MVVKTKSNTKKLKLIKGGVITDEGFTNLFKEFNLTYDSINQPFIDLEKPAETREYVANLMHLLWDTGKADFFSKEAAQRYYTIFFDAFHKNILNTIHKNNEAPGAPRSNKNLVMSFFKSFMDHLNSYKTYYNLILINKYDTRTHFHELFTHLLHAYDVSKENKEFKMYAFAKKYLLKMTLDSLDEVLNVTDITDANGKVRIPALYQVEDLTMRQIPQSIIFLDYLMSLNNKEITDSIKNHISSFDLQKYYVEGGINWEQFQPEDTRLLEELYANKEFRAKHPNIKKDEVTYTKEFTERKLYDPKAILVRHLIFELNKDPNNANYKQLLEIIGKSSSNEKEKKKEKEPIKEKEKPKEVQRQEPRIHQQHLPHQVARPLVQPQLAQSSIREVGNARQVAPIVISQPPVPPSTPSQPSQPSVLRGRQPIPLTFTPEQARRRAEGRIARIMGHLEPTIVSAEVNKQKEELETSLNELINKDPVNAGFLINDAIEFIKEPVPHNVNISQWVDEFDKTADEWAREFSAIRTSPQRKSRLVSTFKKNFKELIKIMPNTNELFVMLVNDMARSAQVARINIPQIQTDSQFAQFQQNLQRYQSELTQQAPILKQSATQSRGRPQLRPLTSQQQSTGRPRAQLERPLMGGNSKNTKNTKNTNNKKKVLNK